MRKLRICLMITGQQILSDRYQDNVFGICYSRIIFRTFDIKSFTMTTGYGNFERIPTEFALYGRQYDDNGNPPAWEQINKIFICSASKCPLCLLSFLC